MSRRSVWFPAAILASLAGWGSAVSAQNSVVPAVAEVRPAVIPNTEQIDLRSEQGREYRIFIAKPAGEAPPEGFPVIYMLDGNAVFGTAVEAARLQRGALGPVVVVAIGYPVDTPFDGIRRFWDLTPKTDAGKIPPHFNPKIVTGGQEEFLDFVIDRVRPEIEKRYPIDGSKQTLFGHSLGGYFVLYTLFNRPDAFQKYVAGSPSIWWNGRSILKDLEAFSRLPADRRRNVGLFVVVGQNEPGHIVLDARNLITTLPPIQNRYQEIQAEGHVSMLPAAINSALRFALGPPQ